MQVITLTGWTGTTTTRTLVIDKMWSDRHLFLPIERKRPVQERLMIRKQANGLRVVDAKGKFAKATPNERRALLNIFEETQAMVPTRLLEDTYIYDTMGHRLNKQSGRLEPVSFKRAVEVKTDYPVVIAEEVTSSEAAKISPRIAIADLDEHEMTPLVVTNHTSRCWNTADVFQVQRAYQLREWSVGQNRLSSDWSEWHEDALIGYERHLRDLGFDWDMINKVSALVTERLPYAGTQRDAYFDALEIFLGPDREAWVEKMVKRHLAKAVEKAAEHKDIATDYLTGYCKVASSIDRVSNYAKRYATWQLEQAAGLKTVAAEGETYSPWFLFMRQGLKDMIAKLRSKWLGAKWISRDDHYGLNIYFGFCNYCRDQYWLALKPTSLRRQFEWDVIQAIPPTDEERSAIQYYLWLHRLAWDNEVKANADHFDNWAIDFPLQREDRMKKELTRLLDHLRLVTHG